MHDIDDNGDVITYKVVNLKLTLRQNKLILKSLKCNVMFLYDLN
jgi:hypothetical protein